MTAQSFGKFSFGLLSAFSLLIFAFHFQIIQNAFPLPFFLPSSCLFFAFYLRTHSCETSPIIATNANFFIESEHESKVKKQKSRQHFDTNKKRTKQTKKRMNRRGGRVEKDPTKVAAGQNFFQICHNFSDDDDGGERVCN